MIRYFLGSILGGGALLVWGVNNWNLAMACKQAPQVLTGMELQTRGWGDNAHVEVTNAATTKACVMAEERTSNRRFRATATTKLTALIPMVSMDSDYVKKMMKFYEVKENEGKEYTVMPTEFCCVLKVPVKNETDVEDVAGLPSYPGVVINAIDSLDGETKALLRSEFPGVKLDNIAIVEFMRKPEPATKGIALTAGGGMLMLCGLGFGAMWLRNRD